MNLLFKMLRYFAPSNLPTTKPKSTPVVLQTCADNNHLWHYQKRQVERTWYRHCLDCPYSEFKHDESDNWQPAVIAIHGTTKTGKPIISVSTR